MKKSTKSFAAAVLVPSAMALSLCLLASCNAPQAETGPANDGSTEASGAVASDSGPAAATADKGPGQDKPNVILPNRAVDDPVFIDVRNATEISGLNLSVPHRLTSMGYDSEHCYSVTGLKSNVTDQPYTLIAYASEDMESIAHRVAEHLGIDQLGDLPSSGSGSSGSPRVFLNPPGDDGYLIQGDILVLIGADWADRSYPYPL